MIKSFLLRFCFRCGGGYKGMFDPKRRSGKNRNEIVQRHQHKARASGQQRANFIFLCPCYALHKIQTASCSLRLLLFNVDLAAKESRLLANNKTNRIHIPTLKLNTQNKIYIMKTFNWRTSNKQTLRTTKKAYNQNKENFFGANWKWCRAKKKRTCTNFGAILIIRCVPWPKVTHVAMIFWMGRKFSNSTIAFWAANYWFPRNILLVEKFSRPKKLISTGSRETFSYIVDDERNSAFSFFHFGDILIDRHKVSCFHRSLTFSVHFTSCVWFETLFTLECRNEMKNGLWINFRH